MQPWSQAWTPRSCVRTRPMPGAAKHSRRPRGQGFEPQVRPIVRPKYSTAVVGWTPRNPCPSPGRRHITREAPIACRTLDPLLPHSSVPCAHPTAAGTKGQGEHEATIGAQVVPKGRAVRGLPPPPLPLYRTRPGLRGKEARMLEERSGLRLPRRSGQRSNQKPDAPGAQTIGGSILLGRVHQTVWCCACRVSPPPPPCYLYLPC